MRHARWIVIGLAVAFFAVCALLARRLHMEENITAMLPDRDPVVNDYRLLIGSFRLVDSLFVDIGAESGKPEDAVAVADELYARLQSSGMFTRIFYRMSQEKMVALMGAMSAKKASLLSERDLAEIETRLKPDEVRRRMEAARRALLEPSGPFVRDQIRRDPLGIDELVIARLDGLSAESEQARIVGGRVWSEDGRHMLMIATPVFPATDTRRSPALIELLDRSRDEALRAAPQGAVAISYVGGHRAALDNADTIKNDIIRSLTAASLGILAAGMLFFRRRLFIVLTFLPAAFGMACALAAFGLFDPLISAIAIGCAVIVISLVDDYGIHLLYSLDNDPDVGRQPTSHVRALLLPLAVSAVTTAAGILCLLLSSLPGGRQMGVFAAVGVLGAAVFAVLALPSFIPRLSARAGRGRGFALPLSDWCGRFLAWRHRHGVAVGVFGIAVLAASVWGLTRLRFEGDVEKLNYLRPGNRLDSTRLLAVWGRFFPVEVIVRGKSREEAMRNNDRLLGALERMRDEGKITSFTSVSEALPSNATQEENRRRWAALWSPERVAALRAEMERASSELKLTPTAFAPFFDGLGAPSPAVIPTDFDGAGLDDLIESHISEADGDCLVLSSFYPASVAGSAEISARVRQAAPGAIIVDRRQVVEHTSSLVRSELKKLALAAAVVTALCLFLLLWRLELVLTCMIAVCLSMMVTLGLLGLFGVPLNLVSSLFIVFIFAAGIDYSAYFMGNALAGYRGEKESDADTLGAVAVGMLTTICGFATLTFARHPALFSLGVAGTVGMAACLGTAVIAVPPITRRLFHNQGRFGTPSLKTIGGTMWAYGYLGGRGILYALVLRPIVALRHRRDRAARERFARRCLRAAAYGLLRDWPYLDSERLYVGASPEAFRPAGIIVANHPSAFDIMVILALPAEMAMVVKRWVWNTPVMGLIVRDSGHILAGEEDTADAVLDECRRRLECGVNVMFFPEGSRSPDENMRRFHKGAFELAVRTGADIIPVYLSDTQACIPPKAFWIGDHRSVAHVLPRVTKDNFDYGLGARALADHVKRKMLEYEHCDWRIAEDGGALRHNIRSLYRYRGTYVEGYVAWKMLLDPICGAIDGLAPEEGVILDLGCGYGIMSHILGRKSRRRQVIGVDFDERKVRVAQQSAIAAPNVRFERQDFLSWDYPAADAVMLVDALHYWSRDKQRAVIAKAAACLRPGGVLIFREASPAIGRAWRHRLVTWGERFTTTVGVNAATPDGLCFPEWEFYLRAFEEEGLSPCASVGPGTISSNVTLVMRKLAR